MTIVDRLATVFEKAFGLEPQKFSVQLSPEEVPNWDSIGHMTMTGHLEEEFHQQFELDEIMEMSTPQKIVDILRARGVTD